MMSAQNGDTGTFSILCTTSTIINYVYNIIKSLIIAKIVLSK